MKRCRSLGLYGSAAWRGKCCTSSWEGLKMAVVRRTTLIVSWAFLMMGTLVAAGSTGEGLTVASPAFHQLVVFSVPAEFKSNKATIERTNGAFYMREQVPEGETIDRWTRMISLTATRDLGANPSATPQAMLARMTAGFQRNCPDTFSSAAPGAQTVDGHEAYEVIASCGRVTAGKDTFSESAIMLAIRGSADLYTLQWTERGAQSSRPPAIDTGYWTRQLARLQPIKLCPLAAGAAPPTPGCAH